MTRQRLVQARRRITRCAPRARLLGVAVLTVTLTAALGLPASAASAQGSNSGVDGCLSAYNYSDPASDYLYASSQGNTTDCQYVYVDIKDGGAPYSWNEAWGYTSTSVVVPSSSWNNPQSAHIGAREWGFLDRWITLDFIY